jgi:flagellin
MRINNNIMALNAHRQLGINQAGASKSMEKLSSGFRINRAGDDAAGLAISEKMRGQIRGLKQAARNAQDGISLIQTAEGALNETHAILQRMRELAVQSATDTNTGVDRDEIQKEINQLAEEINRIAETTEFNTQNLLGGDFEAKFHIGANQGQNVDLEINAMDAKALNVGGEVKLEVGEDTVEFLGVASTDVLRAYAADGEGTILAVKVDGAYYAVNDVIATGDGLGDVDALAVKPDAVALNYDTTNAGDLDGDGELVMSGEGIDVSTQAFADVAITTINDALETVSAERSKLGAMQNRLEHTIANLGTSAENLQAAEARIRDLDMAEEIMAFTKNNILQQAATAMLAQANMAPQSVLQLLG